VRDTVVEPARQAQCNSRVDESMTGDFSSVLLKISIALARRGNPDRYFEEKDEYHPIISNEDWAFFNAQFQAHRGGFSRCNCPYPNDKPSILCTYLRLCDLKFSIDVSIKCLDRVNVTDYTKIIEFANKSLKLLKEYQRCHMEGKSCLFSGLCVLRTHIE
jgi:hypothetical protein